MALALLPGTAACTSSANNGGAAESPPKPTALVNLFTGTSARTEDFGTGGGAGNTFPGAVAPFGMLQWSPDTYPGRTNSPGGYSYEDTQIRGFSLTHLSGVGCPIFQDIPFLPTTVPIDLSPSVAGSYDVAAPFVANFSHDEETAEPGYYRVLLEQGTTNATEVELTATTRTGSGRITFPPTATASVLINAGGSAMANGDAAFSIDPDRHEVSGWVESGQFCFHRARYKVHFAAEFREPFSAYGTWTKQTLAPGSTSASDHADNPSHLRPITGILEPSSTSNGAQAGAYVTFDTRSDPVVEVRVAVSYVSVENARENLRAENPTWDFDGRREATEDEWDDLLGRIIVKGGTDRETRTFYTMLYHALLGPTVFGDTNGQYAGMDGQVHTASGFVPYTTFSGWDVYRSQIPLLALLVPERTSDMMQSLVVNALESGWLPKWSVANGQTDVMVGDPADLAIAGAYAFGAREFDTAAALASMVKGGTEEGVSPNASYVERQGLAGYLQLGYVPHDGTETNGPAATVGNTSAVWGSAATTLEYAAADFAIATFAAALGDQATCERFIGRSANWKHLLNPLTSYLEPRYANGEFFPALDPASMEGYVEGSAAQYTWFVPHDVLGLANAIGGSDITIERLDAFFRNLNAGPTSTEAYLGNEPCAGTPWLYNWLGRPEKTQELVRRAMQALFDDTASGYPGNDDVGQMSSWYVFAALGLYPAIPGTDVLAIGSPLFEEASIQLKDRELVIVGNGAAGGSPYVRSLSVNGEPWTQPWIRFADLAPSARMVFDLAPSPDGAWATAPGDVPPSFDATSPSDACAVLARDFSG